MRLSPNCVLGREKTGESGYHCAVLAPTLHVGETMVPRVKVLKFVTAFAVGGTERQFVHLTRGLDRARFDIQIGCFHRSGPLLNEISALRSEERRVGKECRSR